MTIEPTPRAAELKPCQFCGGECRVEHFKATEHHTPTDIWICSNDAVFGGNCPNACAYASAEAWNTRQRPAPHDADFEERSHD